MPDSESRDVTPRELAAFIIDGERIIKDLRADDARPELIEMAEQRLAQAKDMLPVKVLTA
jgi:hypothetical protein